MLDISWSHLAVIATAAIIFIGPKDLPVALRTVGKFVAKAKSMAREFQTNVDDMIRETEIAEIKKQIDSMQSGSIEQTIEKTVDAKGEIAKAFEPPEFSLEDKKPDEPPPLDPTVPTVTATPIVPAPVVEKEPEPAVARPAA